MSPVSLCEFNFIFELIKKNKYNIINKIFQDMSTNSKQKEIQKTWINSGFNRANTIEKANADDNDNDDLKNFLPNFIINDINHKEEFKNSSGYNKNYPDFIYESEDDDFDNEFNFNHLSLEFDKNNVTKNLIYP